MALKLGPHIRANNSNHDIDNFLFGVDWPVMTWHDSGSEWGRLNTYHANRPRTVITGRIPAVEEYYKSKLGGTIASATVTGTTAAEMIIAMNAPSYVYWRADEINDIHAWSAAFHLAFLKKLIPAGYKGCGPMYAEGNPHSRRFDGFSDWPYHKDLLAYMNAHSESTLLAVNAYRKGDTTYADPNGVTQATADDDAAHLLRIEDAIAYLDEWGYNNVKIVFGETGLEYPINGAVDDAQMVGHAKDINRLFNRYPRIIGGAWYDFSGIDDGYSSYGPSFLYPFVDWAKAELAGTPTEPPPQPPTTPPDAPRTVRTTTTVNLRGKPVIAADNIIAVLPPNKALTLTGEASGNFRKVEAWIHKDYVV